MSDKQTISKRLARCPFCGGDAVTAEMYNTKLKKLFPIVKCLDCECRTPMKETFEEAITAWNTRTPIERILERLEENCFWTSSTYDEDGYCNDDSEEVVDLYKAIEIVKEEGGIE